MGSLPSPHVVMVPIDTAGHCVPFVLFGERLAAEGFTVTILSTDAHIAEILEDPAARASPLRYVELRDDSIGRPRKAVFDERNTDAGKEKVIRLVVEAIEDMCSPNAMQLRGVPTAAFPCVILHDFLTTWAQDAADKLGIQKHLLFVSPVSALAIALQSERLYKEGRVPVTPENENTLITDIPGMPPLKPTELPSQFVYKQMHSWFMYHDHRNCKADVLLVNSFYELEKQAIDGIRNEVIGTPGVESKYLFDIGPLLPESDILAKSIEVVEETDPCILWLNKQKPTSVLYICFGSQTALTRTQLYELALGIEACGVPFLWIMKLPDAWGPQDTSKGPISMTEYLPPGFEERTKERGMIYTGWAYQKRILGHAATGGFLTHCGWNSILESVIAGVPMLTWPVWADQCLNNRYLVDTWKFALELERQPIDTSLDVKSFHGFYTRRVKQEDVTQKAKRLMVEDEGKTLRKNIMDMRMKLRSAVAPGGTSLRSFDDYIALLRSKDVAKASSNGKTSNGAIFNGKTSNGKHEQNNLIEAI